MLEMPLFGNDIGAEPVEFDGVIDELCEQVPQIPLDDHPPDIEHHRLKAPRHKSSSQYSNGPLSIAEAGRLCCTIARRRSANRFGSALAGLEPAVGFVDYINPPQAASDAAIAVK